MSNLIFFLSYKIKTFKLKNQVWTQNTQLPRCNPFTLTSYFLPRDLPRPFKQHTRWLCTWAPLTESCSLCRNPWAHKAQPTYFRSSLYMGLQRNVVNLWGPRLFEPLPFATSSQTWYCPNVWVQNIKTALEVCVMAMVQNGVSSR